ncbi:uncharacterized protein FIBRA_05030 [Fibroporia radiculosa]|uniref:Phosphoglucomutase n=1 Tax=Fibroporia radiculosa TaxID=599839 RepID=J4IAH4_9APHY|nr:uncharacterized protein FIBRA_05030 [Fibroporia radiculosa]CCM02916.1 predicted protein [Fibroporia radiculosa]
MLGLRGRMEAGWSRMNDLIIIQASQGLCAYVLQAVPNAAERGVVVGHDHRHNSERWAGLTAAAFIAHDVKVYLHRGLVHTPLVPFSVKKLNAACGIMITGKFHGLNGSLNLSYSNIQQATILSMIMATNPPLQVYWENAVQIIEPHDKGISNSIKANLEPKVWDHSGVQSSALCIDVTNEMVEAYFESVSALTSHRTVNPQTPLKFVNTSMHGVSHPFMVRAFDAFGFPAFIPVLEQQEPDPEFTTVKFPNPEEKGALDLAINTANQHQANYVLAQDPDSDRFSAAERSPDGMWTMFTGDQLGILFGSLMLDRYKLSGKPLNELAMVASTVSSKMIEAMAHAEGFRFAECLTGFKFIGNTALRLEEEGFEVPFGYEEALGFMFGSEIRDKDGVAASVMFVEMVTSLHAQGKTASSHLQELYTRYGYFQTSNSYFICNDPLTIDKIFAKIRNYDGTATSVRPNYPRTIAGLNVTSVCDLTVGYDSANPPTYKPAMPLSSGHMIQFRAQSPNGESKITLTVRTSGTEPKIKYYLEGSGKNAIEVGVLLPRVVQELGDEWMEAIRNQLGRP